MSTEETAATPTPTPIPIPTPGLENLLADDEEEEVELPDPMDQLQEIFEHFDMDKDGSLTILELAALLRSIGLKPTGDQIHSLLSVIDSNHNGAVEFDELVGTIILPNGGFNDEILVNQTHILDIFKAFDRDNNGVITAAELAGAMAKIGQPLTYKELREMLNEADTDGDGVISFKEFSTVMAKSAIDFFGIPVITEEPFSPTLPSPRLQILPPDPGPDID